MNDLSNICLPPIKIPNRVNLILQLLREEIKHSTLTNAFDKLGMDTAQYTRNMGGLILACVVVMNVLMNCWNGIIKNSMNIQTRISMENLC
jgi:hypothetical protein